jgi:hypothetical protein
MRLASRGRHRPCFRSGLYALVAGMLALGGCSDILGGGESVAVEEVWMVDDDGNTARVEHLLIRQGSTQHVTFRFANRNGVPVTNPEAYSVNIISIANPALFSWRSESARAGFITGVADGYTTFRLDVLRGDSVVYHSARIGVDVYTPSNRGS